MTCYSLALLALLAQNPMEVAPQHYHLDLENAWVRVVRVTYGPREKSVKHEHPAKPVVFVYVTDGGPMEFRHGEGLVLERPPVKAGGIRFSRGNQETHEVIYNSDLPSTYLRLELKTEPTDMLAPGRDVRTAREPAGPDGSLWKAQFTNGQVRIVRVICAPGKACPMSDRPADPAILVPIVGSTIQAAGGAQEIQPGNVTWFPGATSDLAWTNTGTGPLEMVRVELRSKPVAATK